MYAEIIPTAHGKQSPNTLLYLPPALREHSKKYFKSTGLSKVITPFVLVYPFLAARSCRPPL